MEKEEEKEEGKNTNIPKGIFKDVASMTCRNSRSIAHIEGAIYKNWKVKEAFPIIAPCVTAGKTYAEATKGPPPAPGPPVTIRCRACFWLMQQRRRL